MLSTNEPGTKLGGKYSAGVPAGMCAPEPSVQPFRVGLIGFSDGRLRVHETLAGAIRRHADILAKAIAGDPIGWRRDTRPDTGWDYWRLLVLCQDRVRWTGEWRHLLARRPTLERPAWVNASAIIRIPRVRMVKHCRKSQ